MWHVNGTRILPESILWHHNEDRAGDEEEGVKVSFHLGSFSSQYQRRQAMQEIERLLERNDVPWITSGQKAWTLDLDKLKEFVPELPSMNWFKGKVSIEPEFETEERIVSDKPQYHARVAFYVVPGVLGRPVVALDPPIEIQNSLARLKHDYPDPAKVAFIMMQFGETAAHDEIVKAIRKALESHGISGVKANDKEYHDDLFPNVMTYLYGCGFGIAVFERIEAEEFNPNVSLEVGYMLALRKPVCLLKDKTLKTLHTDLVSKLYKTFDTQDPGETIPDEISQWLSDKGIV